MVAVQEVVAVDSQVSLGLTYHGRKASHRIHGACGLALQLGPHLDGQVLDLRRAGHLAFFDEEYPCRHMQNGACSLLDRGGLALFDLAKKTGCKVFIQVESVFVVVHRPFAAPPLQGSDPGVALCVPLDGAHEGALTRVVAHLAEVVVQEDCCPVGGLWSSVGHSLQRQLLHGPQRVRLRLFLIELPKAVSDEHAESSLCFRRRLQTGVCIDGCHGLLAAADLLRQVVAERHLHLGLWVVVLLPFR